MPIPGATVSGSARELAVSAIGRIAGAAERESAGASGAVREARNLTMQFQELDPANITALNTWLKHPLVWGDDMICWGRANLGATMINQVAGRGTGAAEDTAAAAIAVLKAPPSATHWSFHAGIAVKPEGKGVHIIDHYSTPRPLPIEEWAAMFGAGMDSVTVRSPFAGIGIGKTEVTTPANYRWMDEKLTETWKSPEQYGVTVREET